MNRIPVLQPSTARTRVALLVASFVLLLASVFPVAEAHAQVVFDNFDDGDVSDVFTFSETGGGIGVGTTDGRDATADAALSVGINPADVGSFAGFGIPGGAGTTDVSGTTYLSFYFRPATVQEGNLPLTMEINLHEDTNGDGAYDGNVEDEYQAVYNFSTGSGYVFVQIPLASFSDDNAVFAGSNDGFDFGSLLEIVIAFGGLQGPEFAFSIDDVIFTDGAQSLSGMVAEIDFFDDGDVSDVFTFSETGGGVGVGTTDGSDGATDAALSVGVNPADAGSFVGFGVPGGEGVTDISDAEYLVFQIRSTTVQAGNLPITLEINLHEDTNGNGAYDGDSEDEYQALYSVSLGSDYVDVAIPLASFSDDNSVFAGSDDGFDFSNLLEIVVAIVAPQGPEFAFAIDQMGVNGGTPTSVEEQAEVPGVYALGPAYPNPFTRATQFDLTVEQRQHVTVEVFDVLGRSVAMLHDGVLRGQETRTFTFDANSLPSGTYLYRVSGETFSETRSVVLTK